MALEGKDAKKAKPPKQPKQTKLPEITPHVVDFILWFDETPHESVDPAQSD